MWNKHNYYKDLKSSINPYQCEFDKKYYGLTIINEWGLVCDKQHLAGLTQTICKYLVVKIKITF